MWGQGYLRAALAPGFPEEARPHTPGRPAPDEGYGGVACVTARDPHPMPDLLPIFFDKAVRRVASGAYPFWQARRLIDSPG